MRDTGGMTLIEFLLARVTEDEAVARAAVGTAVFTSQTGRWVAEDVRDEFGAIPLIFAVTDSGAKTQVANFETAWERDERRAHIARHDPERVLAECDAKRRIVEMHGYEGHECPEVSWGTIECPTLAIFAVVYANHPDYREEWRP